MTHDSPSCKIGATRSCAIVKVTATIKYVYEVLDFIPRQQDGLPSSPNVAIGPYMCAWKRKMV